ILGDGDRPCPVAGPPDCSETARLIVQALVDEPPAVLGGGPTIRAGFSPELDGLRASSREAREWIAGLEQAERERTGIKSLKVGFNKVFGYYIEVSRANISAVPPDYQRKQTLVNAERYITPELKEYESRVLNAEERIADLEEQVYRRVLAQVAAAADSVRAAAQAVAQLDVLSALAEVAVRRRYVRPELDDSTVLEIVGGRHPVVEVTLETGQFVP